MFHNYNFGNDRNNIRVLALVNGTATALIRKGRYLLTITDDQVLVRYDDTTCPVGRGTPLNNGTQLYVNVPEDTNFAFQSASGNGVALFTLVQDR